MTDEQLQERQRCEKIIQNYLSRYKNDLRKTEMLKNILSKIRNPSCHKKSLPGGGRLNDLTPQDSLDPYTRNLNFE